MGSLSTRFARTSATTVASLILASAVALTLDTRSEARTAASSLPASLCNADEAVLLSCTIGRRMASVCGQTPGHSVYRFGRPGRIELTAGGLRHASRSYSGGGESQIHFSRNGYSYILYDRTVRTGFGPDGKRDPQFSRGLVVRSEKRKLLDSQCRGNGGAMLSGNLPRFMPAGKFLDH